MARNPCLSCGVCCTLFRVSFYWGEADDVQPGGVPVGLTAQLTPHRLMMKGTGGANPRCVALEGEPGRAVLCGIHERRPSVCHAFTASWAGGEPNERCDAARARFGLPPLTPEDWMEPEPEPGGEGDDAPFQPAA